jgi:hypothetical protein
LEEKVLLSEQGERSVWGWLQQVIVMLGHDGMGSDESDMEDNIHIVYRVKPLPWRRNMKKEMDIIDSGRIQRPNLFSN